MMNKTRNKKQQRSDDVRTAKRSVVRCGNYNCPNTAEARFPGAAPSNPKWSTIWFEFVRRSVHVCSAACGAAVREALSPEG